VTRKRRYRKNYKYYNKNKKYKSNNNADTIDYLSRCITESIFWLTPYILLFVILGLIFS
jgi:hypothetical protein